MKSTVRFLSQYLKKFCATSLKGHVCFKRSFTMCAMKKFVLNLADDLNISPALAALFDMVREINSLCDMGKVSIHEAEETLDFLAKIDEGLGVLPLKPEEEVVPAELLDALQKRELARSEKNWQLADECRNFIQARGYLIEDTPTGVRLKKGKIL